MSKIKSVARLAMRDMVSHFNELEQKDRSRRSIFSNKDIMNDRYVVRDKELQNKKTTFLNQELGLHILNHIGNKNGTRK